MQNEKRRNIQLRGNIHKQPTYPSTSFFIYSTTKFEPSMTSHPENIITCAHNKYRRIKNVKEPKYVELPDTILTNYEMLHLKIIYSF